MKYRKKPIEIEAVQVKRMLMSEPLAYPAWLDEAWTSGVIRISPGEGADPLLRITTLEGVMGAGPDDWIIRGVKGELYPCKPDIFALTYEPVVDDVALQNSEARALMGVAVGNDRIAGLNRRMREALAALDNDDVGAARDVLVSVLGVDP